MILFVIILAIISLYGIKIREDKETVLSPQDTTAINGIFIMLVFISHCWQYLELPDTILNVLYEKFRNIHNQLIVTTFLAFSGYGVMRQALAKGTTYFKDFPKKRILKVLVNFDIAVLIFIILGIIIGTSFDLKTIVLSFIGWTSVGNSNWYIFTIVALYAITYVSFRLFKDSNKKITIATTLGCLGYIVLLDIVFNQDAWFYSTALCYPLGMWLALYKEKCIECFDKKGFLSVIVLGLVFIGTYPFRYNDYIMNIHSCAFVLIIVWALVRVQIGNAFLNFLGKHLFSFFILQRIPMIILQHYGIISGENYFLFGIVSFVATILMTQLFDKYVAK